MQGLPQHFDKYHPTILVHGIYGAGSCFLAIKRRLSLAAKLHKAPGFLYLCICTIRPITHPCLNNCKLT